MNEIPFRPGVSLRQTDPAFAAPLAALFEQGLIDHIQLQMVPGPGPENSLVIETLEAAGARVLIHAPYHVHGVNPCSPGAVREQTAEQGLAAIENAMALSFEAADRFSSPVIVIHAGTFGTGERESAVRTFGSFLSEYRDDRLVLENLPATFRKRTMLGTTAAELLEISKGRLAGFCLDYAHLACTAGQTGLDFGIELAAFEQCDVRMQHLSNPSRDPWLDRHLPLDSLEGGLDFSRVMPEIGRRPQVPLSLEYHEDAAFYLQQLEVFKRLYHRYRGEEPGF
jgi:sugar phosphate isomerase/epimerase